MLKRYAIWDKTSPVITPSGAVYTAEEWKDKYPAAKLDAITIVCQKGEINGGFYGTLGGMIQLYESQGCNFSGATTDEEKLQVIEDFEDSRNQQVDDGESTAEERIAAALEFQNLLALEDVNDISELGE